MRDGIAVVGASLGTIALLGALIVAMAGSVTLGPYGALVLGLAAMIAPWATWLLLFRSLSRVLEKR